MSVKEILLEQFAACYDEDHWFVALRNAIRNLTAEQAAWKPDGADNSIWEIVSHLNFYNFAYLERFKGVDYVYPVDDNAETFSGGVTDEAWAAEIARFDAIMSEFRDLIESADEAKFEQTVSATRTDIWAELISHINVHNAHHGGQIVLMRKLQGCWDASKGVS